jgi:dipeptidyl aminopeptidase/acylaminoacyl peptidase
VVKSRSANLRVAWALALRASLLGMIFRLPQPYAAKATPWLALAVAGLVLLHPAGFAQTTPVPRPDQSSNVFAPHIKSLIEKLNAVRSPTSVAISPDGAYLAWAFNGAHGSELHLTGIAPAGTQDGAWDRVISPDTIGDVTRGAPGDCSVSHPAWSPDGERLAFLSNCANAEGQWQASTQDNVFVWTMRVNGIRQASHLHGEVSSIQWSPDGKSIGFLYVENATRPAGALNAMKPWSGVIGEDGIEVQRVYGVDVSSGQSDWLTPADLHVYEFSWSPGAREITFAAAKPPGENNWWVAKLYSQGLVWDDKGRIPAQAPDTFMMAPMVIFDPASPGPLHGMQIAVPRFSPDGLKIAFIGGLMSDQGSTGGEVYVIPAAGLKPGEQPSDATPNRLASPAWIAWLDENRLLVSEHVGGNSHITALDLKTGQDDPSVNLTLPANIISWVDVMSVSIAKTGDFAFIRESFEHGPEVWAGPLNNMQQISHLNDAVKPSWGKAESIEYTNDGFHIQGWLLYPAGWTANDSADGKKYPLVVSVHGGPSAAVTPRWPGSSYSAVPFSALGYFVFMPNPRGSFGQGERFTQANIKDFGYGDLSDILAGVDLIEKRFPIDTQREGITGWSYGGFMTMFAVTQTTRFKAAVAGAGIANWQSYYGENSIDQWMLPFFGASVYDDPRIYAKSSPIDYILHAKTPTLVVVGDRDGECPAPQSFEFWHALKAQGVKTQLVVYPNEGHHFSDPEHQRDVLERALAWFETEMPSN